MLAVQANSPDAMTTQVETPVETVGGKLTGINGPPSYEKAKKRG